jgi:hypothetical protein
VLLFAILGSLGLAVAADEPRRFTILPLPTLDVTPETGLSVGAVALMNFRPFDSARPSQAEVELAVTLKRQAIVSAETDLFLPDDRVLLRFRGAWLRFPELYWGIGADTPASAEEGYDNRRFDLELDPLYRPVSHLFVGPSAAVYGMWGIVPDGEDALLDDVSTVGADGGWSVGAGGAVLWEGRDNRLNPEPGGSYAWLRALTFRPGLGSDFQFTRLELDTRAYPALGPVHFAVQGLARLHAGAPPFRQLALQGGDPMGRGLYTGRFRDQHLLGGQVEVRQFIAWRFGAVAFGGASAVAPTLSGFGSTLVRPSAGGGIRFRIDDQDDINLRIDVAWAGDGEGGGTGFYASFGEAF